MPVSGSGVHTHTVTGFLYLLSPWLGAIGQLAMAQESVQLAMTGQSVQLAMTGQSVQLMT